MLKKGRSKEIWMNIAFWVFLSLGNVTKGQIPLITVTPNPVEIGSNLTVECEVRINHKITFFVDGEERGFCPFPLGGLHPCTPVDISQDNSANTTTWTFQANLSHLSNWTCRRSASDSPPQVLNMYKCPDTILNQSGLSSNVVLNESSSTVITVEVDCLYSSSSPEIQLQFKIGADVLVHTGMNCTTSGTICPTDQTAYQCVHEISYETNFQKGTSYRLHVGVIPSVGTCDSLAIFHPYTLTFRTAGQNGSDRIECDALLISVLFVGFTLIYELVSISVLIKYKIKWSCISDSGLVSVLIALDVLFSLLLWCAEYFGDFKKFIGYSMDWWVNEENTPITNSDRYMKTNHRGTLLIKEATEGDNGIYQGILKYGDSEQRVNAVLHVTGDSIDRSMKMATTAQERQTLLVDEKALHQMTERSDQTSE